MILDLVLTNIMILIIVLLCKKKKKIAIKIFKYDVASISFLLKRLFSNSE